MNLPSFEILPRAIAIDLDGTLLDSQTRLSEKNRRALERCIERGIPIIIATSRPARIFNRIFPADLAQKCSYVLMNGAAAFGVRPLSGHYRVSLPEDTARSIVNWALSITPRIRITLEIDGYEFATNWDWNPATLWQRNSATPDMVLSLEEGLKRQPCKVALGGPDADLPSLAAQLQQKFGGQLSVVWALMTNPLLNVTSPEATKSNALLKLLTPHGISLSDVLAFGDDLPDLDMLQACGIPVAMANAFPEVKAICPYETASNDEDGVALVLEKMLAKSR